MAEYFNTNNKFGIWYVITRLALLILIILQIVLLIIGILHGGLTAGSIVWYVFTFLVLAIGLIAAWKEHFLMALIFAIVEVILVISGFVMGGAVISSVGVVLCVVCAIIYTIMLFMSGSRDMGAPQIC